MDTVCRLPVQDSMELKKRKDGAAVALVQKLAVQQGLTRRPEAKPQRWRPGRGGRNSGVLAAAQLAAWAAAQLAAWQRFS